MMKTIIYLLFATFTIHSLNAQSTRYQTRSAMVEFEASVPSFEPIQAVNNSATIVLDSSDGKLAALILVKGYRFPIALMQEHFNENYAESDTYPKATLRGTLADFNIEQLSEKKRNYILNGTLEFHGVTQKISLSVELSKIAQTTITLSSSFTLIPEDYQIKIPAVVSKKIADEIHVSVNGELILKE